jgi:hypothetical protein
MPRVNRQVLKDIFQSGAKPSAGQFATFIDSVFNFAEDTSLLGLNDFDATLRYNTGDTSVSSMVIYRANKPTGPGAFQVADWDKIAGGTSGGLQYKGTWDANANVPDLVNATPNAGDYYLVSVAGNTNLDGITDWGVGDWAISNGTNWAKIDNTEDVKDATSLGSGVAIYKQNLNAILQFLSATSVDGSINLTGGSDTIDFGIQFDDNNAAPNRTWSAQRIDAGLITKEPANPNIQGHIADMNNPHNVTKAQLNLGFVQNTRVNYSATIDPSPSDDSTQSYSVGSMWINNTTKVFFICVDATAGAAVWKDEGEISNGQNTGTGAGVFKTRSGDVLQFLSLINGNGSLQISPSTDTIDLSVAFGDSGTSSSQAWSAFKINQELSTKEPANPNIQAHIADMNNPHNVTKAQLNLGFVQNIKVNYTATTDPGPSNDSTQSYSVGSTWINTTTKVFYVCLDATAGAAVWQTEGQITDGQNVGSGTGIYKGRLGTLIQFLSLLSGNGSLQITPSTNTIDLSIAFGDSGTSANQAWSASKTNAQINTREPANPNIQAHIANFNNPHLVTAAQVGLGNVQNIKNNFAATADPISSNDSSQGYATGSNWINTTNQKEFVCLSASVGNAVWRETTSYFGNDYLVVENNTVVQTTVVAPSFANYTTPAGTFKLSTGTRNGTYKITWSCLISTGSKAGQFQLKNITSANPQVVATVEIQGHNITDVVPVGWTGNVQLSGVNQDFVIQFNTKASAQPTTIRQIRIEIYRVG